MKKAIGIIAAVLLFSCGKSGNNDEIKYYDVERTPESGAGNVYLINDQNNQNLARIQYNAEQNSVEISRGNEFWLGEIKNEKRKFYDQYGEVMAEIKFKDDGFKLRDPQGQLIWKIKMYDDKIKISDNEEMENAFEIKKKNSYLADLHQNEQTLGSIEFSPQNSPAVIKSDQRSFYFTGPGNNIGAALLLIEEIQPEHQFIILSQLITQNK